MKTVTAGKLKKVTIETKQVKKKLNGWNKKK